MHQLRGNQKEKDYLFLKTGYEQVKVFFEDILYLEASGNYLSFVLKDQKLLSRMTISEAEALLPESRFMRSHRSFIVGLQHIEKVEKHQLWIKGIAVPIGSLYSQSINLYLQE